MEEIKIIKKFYSSSNLPSDDCYSDGNGLLISTDSLSEETHFLHEWSSPRDLATKLIEVNVSDIISSGGIPKICLLNLGLSKLSNQKTWINAFSGQLKKLLKKYKIQLVGGDTYHSPITNLTLTILGKCKSPILRENGNVGDFLYLTGEIGGSVLGLEILKKKKTPSPGIETLAVKRHLRPVSRMDLFPGIARKYKISSAMDITDGLIQDSLKLAKASSLRLIIDLDRVPIWKKKKSKISIQKAIQSGEELEILFLSPEAILEKGITRIGRAVRGKGVWDISEEINFSNLDPGFLHFESKTD
ncbi:MAG: thiamine-phosphate kinase [Leptospiraceae bacterium]|nr:thiamine-phosphate kinase [Leptospiraceae bacterium]MCP5512115.1 thiamine-phosphate kinase [Leptospiraceae bacterium]